MPGLNCVTRCSQAQVALIYGLEVPWLFITRLSMPYNLHDD